MEDRCLICKTSMKDVGEELVCPSCGRVSTKYVIQRDGNLKGDTTLGSYLGPNGAGYAERFAPGFKHMNTTFKYLKIVSDYPSHSPKLSRLQEMVTRICQQLKLDASTSRIALEMAQPLNRLEYSVPQIATYCIIQACKNGRSTIGPKNVIRSMQALGHRVKLSDYIQIALDVGQSGRSKTAEEYLMNVLGPLKLDGKLERFLLVRATELLSKVSKFKRGGHNPRTLAAAAVYAADREVRKRKDGGLTQRQVATAVGLAEYTVREASSMFRSREKSIPS